MKDLFGTNFSLFVGEKPLDKIPTSFFVGEKPTEDVLLTDMTFTTTMILDDLDAEPLSEEQAEKLRTWFTERMDRDFMNAMLGRPSEYQHSLRAAGSKV
jgi:hypothetical protein